MKKMFISLFISVPVISFSQNVGIGTTTPVAKLNIVGSSGSPAIPGAASSGIFRVGVSAIEGIDFGKLGISPFSAWMQAGYNGNTPDPLSLQPMGGNVGIGTNSPVAKLQINHNSLFAPGIRLVDSGFTNSGVIEFRNATLTGGMTMTASATSNFSLHKSLKIASDSMTVLTIGGQGYVGIRDISPDYPLDVAGDINTTGRILINDNPGTSGQVLTSNGSADPSWQSSSFSNNTRFAASFNAANINTPVSYTNIYNTNTTNVTISAGSITVNTPGLYHFEGYISLIASYSALATSVAADISFTTGPVLMGVVTGQPLNRNFNTLATYELTNRFSQDVYIISTGTVSVASTVFSTLPGGVTLAGGTIAGKITGYLISE